ncbi:MAG: Gfo/Idh/MocA family oxidoreductase [Chloroflexi bacterium]|nr:Gfo/Idh/MocA family oxidoreductase [Chloroflexota bacterium]
MEKIRVGIVGAGLIAPMHAAGYQEMPDQAEVVAICDSDEEKARDQAAMFGARVYTDFRALIADPQVDLVDVLLPHHLHYPAAIAALDAGKHLLLEKPVAMTYREALEIYRKAQHTGVHFTVAENTRYVKAYIEAEKIIRSGQLGEITLVRTFLPANERVRLSSDDFWGKRRHMGGGALIDSGPHSFYLLKWLFGDFRELAAYTSRLYRDSGSEVEDNADVRGMLACGAEFHCGFTFTAEVPHSERLEVYGTQGSLIIDQLALPPAKLYADPADFDGVAVEGVEYDPMGWHYFSIVDEVKDFVTSVWEDRPPAVDPLDCCYAVRVIEAAYESARSGHRIVTV